MGWQIYFALTSGRHLRMSSRRRIQNLLLVVDDGKAVEWAKAIGKFGKLKTKEGKGETSREDKKDSSVLNSHYFSQEISAIGDLIAKISGQGT